MNPLEQYKRAITVVADTADFKPPAHVAPRAATTHPTWIVKVVPQPQSSESPLRRRCDLAAGDAARLDTLISELA